MATARRRARGPMRGRTKFALGLVVLMSVAAVVIWRRSEGNGLAKEVLAMNRELISIDAERRLGMHVATEGQTRTLTDSSSVP